MVSVNFLYGLAATAFRSAGAVFVVAAMLVACSSSPQRDSAGDEAGPFEYMLDENLMFDLLAAEFAGNTGDLDLSVQYYSQAAARTDDPRVAARAVYIAVYNEAYEEALRLLERWKQLAPDDIDVTRLYAITHLKLNQPDAAAGYIQSILDSVDGDQHEKAVAVKQLLAKETDTATGLAVLESLNESRPGNVHMLILQARYAAQMEQYDDAIALLDRTLEIDPELQDVHIIKSRILSAQGKSDEALSLFEMVLRQQPDNANLRLQYARMLVEARKYEEAKREFSILLDAEPDNPDIILSLGLLDIETGELDEASTHLERLLELGQQEDVANYYLGRIAQNNEQPKIAISYYLRVREGDYEFDAKLRIAGLFASLGRVEEGLRQLELLAEQQTAWSNKVLVWLAQGEILNRERRYEEAMEIYNRGLQQKPDDSDLLYARAIMAEKIDRIDITERDLLKVLSAEPENANALNALGYTLADRTERLEEARKYIQRAAELVPDDPAILDSLGWVNYRLGNMQQALQLLARAFEKLEDAEIAAHYGEVLWIMDQREEAERIWKIGLEKNAEHPVLLETMQRLKQ